MSIFKQAIVQLSSGNAIVSQGSTITCCLTSGTLPNGARGAYHRIGEISLLALAVTQSVQLARSLRVVAAYFVPGHIIIVAGDSIIRSTFTVQIVADDSIIMSPAREGEGEGEGERELSLIHI